jgi:uncharacterized phiE125 gp8 family phage protein
MENPMPLTITTPPAEEPVTLAEAKAYLKLDTTDEDALITRLITAARFRAEWHTSRALVTQSWIYRLDAWPCGPVLDIPLQPLQSVSAVTVTARDGSTTTLSSTLYTVDTAGGRLAFAPLVAPPADLAPINAIAIAFTAGYGDASAVPAPLKVAVLAFIAFLYEYRGDAPADPPPAVAALLAPYRILRI